MRQAGPVSRVTGQGVTRVQCPPQCSCSHSVRLEEGEQGGVAGSDQQSGGERHQEQRNVEYLSSVVHVTHPHQHLLLQLIKASVVIMTPVSGWVLSPGLETGVTVGDDHHILQSITLLQDTLTNNVL